VEQSFIRVEADELTYPLHIMIRYECERAIFNDGLSMEELPKLWNQKVKEYLNLDVQNDADGLLQDVHWSGGAFGYFPTYALGSAYAAQIYYAMLKDLNLDDVIRANDLKKVNAWLKEKIHQYGKTKTPDEIIMDVTSEPFNVDYYVRYLKEKYGAIYLGA
jgi:carboxypeptidase Taq